jgi:hypothetical protein
MRWLVAVVAFATLGLAGCAKASEEQKGKRTPLTPPPAQVEIPAALSIDVTVDGAPAPPLTGDKLRATKPDFADPERQAWKLTTLLPELDRPGAAVEATGPTGVVVRLERPATPTAMDPVLFLTRRGDVVVALVDPANPFPDYHGQGGRLRRPGDPLTRLSPVSRLAVVH